MAVIEKGIELVGSKGRDQVTGLFDSGSTYSCIEKTLAQKLETIVPLPKPLEFETAKKGEKVEAKERVSLDFYLDGYRFSDEFFVLPDLSEELVIGATTMQKWRFKLDFEHEEVMIDPRVTRLRFLSIRIQVRTNRLAGNEASDTKQSGFRGPLEWVGRFIHTLCYFLKGLSLRNQESI